MKKFLVATCSTLCLALGAQAQEMSIFNHVSVGVGIGTTGLSVEVASPVTDYFSVRAGLNFLPNVKVKTDLEIGEPDFSDYLQHTNNMTIPEEIEVEGQLAMTTGKVLIDIYPFKKSSFFLTGGFYFGSDKIVKVYNTDPNALDAVYEWNKFAASAQGQAAGATEIGAELGDYLLKPNADGMEAAIKVASVRPYLGLGFGRAVPHKHRFACSFEMGCQFWGTPKIYCNDEELKPEKVDGDGGEFIKTLSKVKVYPNIAFRINGRIL